MPWGFRILQSVLPGPGSEFPTPALCLIHVLAAVTQQKGYALPALRHPYSDVFGLSGAAKSPSWCSQCLCRHSLSRRRGSSAGRCLVQTFLSRQSPKALEVSQGHVREGGLHGHYMVPCHRAHQCGKPHSPPATAGTSLSAETGESLFFDDPCLKLLCCIFLSWNDHCLSNSLLSGWEELQAVMHLVDEWSK